MAQVTLRDLATNEDIVVPPEGFIFGRVGGDADIQIEDNSISRRQARVSLKGGQWLLETLAVPQGTKAPRPIALQEGATFNVGQSEFEVVQVEEDEEEEMDPAAKTIAPPSARGGKPAAPPPAAKKPNPPPKDARTTPSSSAQKRAPGKEEAAGGDDGGGGAMEIPKGGIGALFVGVPKGLAYYLVNVPKLMFNPIGTIKKTIEELPNEPMGPIALIGYALPAGLITMLLGSWAGGLAALIGPGHVFVFSSFFPIVSLIIGVVVAVVTGFVLHPVLTWIINKLKGKSDARSRTNYFLQLQTVQILFAIPTALVTILTSLPIPLIPLIASIIGLLLGVVSALVMMFLQVKWFELFNVVKWFRTVVLVLTGLGVLGALGNGVNGIRFALATPSTIAVPSVPDTGGDTEVAEGDDTANAGGLEEMPKDPEEAKAWALKKQKQLEAKAKAQAAAAMKDAEKVKDEAEAAAPEPKKKDAPPAKDEPKAVAAKDEPRPEPEPAPVKDTPPPPKVADAAPAPSGAYGAFFRKREAMERLFDADPTILQKNEDVRKLYSDYLDTVGDVDKKWNKERSKKPELEKLNARLREAELFTKTGKTVDQLADKLKIK